MAYAGRETYSGLRLDTKFARDQSPSTNSRYGEEQFSGREASVKGQDDDE